MPGIFDAYFEALHLRSTVKPDQAKQKLGFLWSGLEHDEAVNDQVAREQAGSRFERAIAIREEIMQTLREELEFLAMSMQCAYCNITYTQNQNFGFHRCAWHPHAGAHPRFYDCCGQVKEASGHSGCTPCDHSAKYNPAERWHSENRTIAVPLLIAMQYNIPSSNYTVENQADLRLAKAVVRRCK